MGDTSCWHEKSQIKEIKNKGNYYKKEEKSGKYGIEVVLVSYEYDCLKKTRQNNNSFPTIAKRKGEEEEAAKAPQSHPSAVPDE